MKACDLPYLLFYLGDELYALSVAFVREMLCTPEVTKLPDSTAWMRGVINLRGRIVRLLDLRRLLGIRPLSEELHAFEAMFDQLKSDHIDWLNELEACIREGRKFQLATNPHECNFGRWYYCFKTQNGLVAKHLPRFEAPHNAIHQTAEEALALARDGDPDQALSLIEKKRKTSLADLIKLFDKIMELLHETHTEIAVVLVFNNAPLAMTVDRVISVERLPLETLENPPDVCASACNILKICRRKISDELVTVLDPNHLLASTN